MVQDTSQGSMTVTQYRSFFYNLEIVQRLDEQALISVAKAGLKEEIRQGLDGNVFPTLEALFEEATEVEEILKTEKTPPNSPRKCAQQPDRQSVPGDQERDRKMRDMTTCLHPIQTVRTKRIKQVTIRI
ncbi:hypothetical protein Bca52824_033219 [Brassica carinata]|uniref:Uncharacterized protein n=1 Tax=Brassica carinata TaxID=52824 RepID=A0A8X7SC21_BRACI|nr:hypothetical protein Bca52824_033219 [Brassica carinata]